MKINFNKKQKSSALIIAIVVGAIMSVVMVGSSLIIMQRLQISAQSRQGKLAYRAALSGIEDGLMIVKQAEANSTLSKVLGTTLSGNTILEASADQTRIYHDLQISSGAISSFPSIYSNLSVSQLDTQLTKLGGDNAVSAIGVSNIEKFSKLNIDDTIEVNIPPDFDPQTFGIYFSRPHYYVAGLPTYYANYFTPLNIQIIDTSKSGEQQLAYDETVADQTISTVYIDPSKFSACAVTGSCKLKIRAQAAKKGTLLDGGGSSVVSGKFIYLAIVARDAYNNLLNFEDARPGVITVSSTGYAGQAVRKLSAEVNSTTGAYLGLFDFGIYCGDKCEGRGVDEL